ncbi:MAG: hypothetical protein F9K15_19805 [Zoogloea sp.]|nr:MAG: hypothetical protein F9K15_19805 [Zoogloea sp.]
MGSGVSVEISPFGLRRCPVKDCQGSVSLLEH